MGKKCSQRTNAGDAINHGCQRRCETGCNKLEKNELPIERKKQKVHSFHYIAAKPRNYNCALTSKNRFVLAHQDICKLTVVPNTHFSRKSHVGGVVL